MVARKRSTRQSGWVVAAAGRTAEKSRELASASHVELRVHAAPLLRILQVTRHMQNSLHSPSARKSPSRLSGRRLNPVPDCLPLRALCNKLAKLPLHAKPRFSADSRQKATI